MTYNEFMKDYKEFIKYVVELEIHKSGTAKDLAKRIGTSPSTVSRLKNGNMDKDTDKWVSKMIGKDIRDMDITDIKQLKIKYLEEQLSKLKNQLCEEMML